MVDASTSAKGAAQFDANDFGVAAGVVTLDDNVIKTVTTDTGTVDPSAHGINLLGTSNRGISFSASTDTITATIENADSNQKGVAQFDNTDFVASNGNVSLADVVLKGVTTDDGAVTPSGHSVSLLGGEGIDVNHTGAVITVKGEDASTSNKGVASFNSADFDVTSGDVTIKANAVGNGQLTNSTVKFGSTTVSLGDSSSTISGLTQVEVGNLRLTGNTISNTDTNGILYIDPNPVGDSGDLYILGNLTVQGTTTTINSTELSINDLNIVLADSATNAAEADGAGLTVNGASATFSYSATGDKWTMNKPLDVTGAITSSANVEAGSLTINGVAFEQLVDSEVANLLTAGEGIDLTYTDNTNELLIAAELATKSNPGVASFDSDQFTVTTGAVTIHQMDGGTY